LSKAEYKEISGDYTAVDRTNSLPADFWAYLDDIPIEDFEGHTSNGAVDWRYREGTGTYEVVNVNTEDASVFMILVIDLLGRSVFGHYLARPQQLLRTLSTGRREAPLLIGSRT
jgi:hypothetical protein